MSRRFHPCNHYVIIISTAVTAILLRLTKITDRQSTHRTLNLNIEHSNSVNSGLLCNYTTLDMNPISKNSHISLESLPVELIAEILGELDLASLAQASQLSRRFRQIISDPSINPWRSPILRTLRSNASHDYEPALTNLAVRQTVPRHNFLEILSIARPAFILHEATLPNLADEEWKEVFERRFLPSWKKWRKTGERWRSAYMKTLARTLHRSISSCTADEAWTKYIVLNRNGTANELDGASRHFNPLAIFHEMKLQNNLAHLQTRIRLVVSFADVRILALGVLYRPKTKFLINDNARALLHPPGISVIGTGSSLPSTNQDDGTHENHEEQAGVISRTNPRSTMYERLTRPLPIPEHAEYPFPTSQEKRWLGDGELEEEGMDWVGGMLLTAQIVGPHTLETSDGQLAVQQDLDLVIGPNRSQFASFSWADLDIIAPWMGERVLRRIEGPGLGI